MRFVTARSAPPENVQLQTAPTVLADFIFSRLSPMAGRARQCLAAVGNRSLLRATGSSRLVFGLSAPRPPILGETSQAQLARLVQLGANSPMVRRSGYQPDNFGNLWICLVRGVCHAGSVTYDINRHLPEPLPCLRRPVLVRLVTLVA